MRDPGAGRDSQGAVYPMTFGILAVTLCRQSHDWSLYSRGYASSPFRI